MCILCENAINKSYGWECEIMQEECMFLIPNERICRSIFDKNNNTNDNNYNKLEK